MTGVFLFLCHLLWREEVKDMAVVYATLILKGKKTLEQVPQLLQAQVEELLEALEIPAQ